MVSSTVKSGQCKRLTSLTLNHFRLVSLGLVASVEAQLQENDIYLLYWLVGALFTFKIS